VVPTKTNFTMKTSKALMLAAATALTLGVGSAMAQSEVPSMASVPFVSGQRQAGQKVVNEGAGSSDVGAPVHFDYTTLANPG
jgi:uncharacterized membrane protein